MAAIGINWADIWAAVWKDVWTDVGGGGSTPATLGALRRRRVAAALAMFRRKRK